MPADPKPAETPLDQFTRQIVPVPTVSFREHLVHRALARFAEERGLVYREDAHGNGLIEYRRGRRTRPLVLGAHTDHPGFVVTAVSRNRLDLEFHGGLPATYGKGERVRIYSPEGEDRGAAEITSVTTSETRGTKRIAGAKARLVEGATAGTGDFALWDVAECRVRGQIVHARQCDDLIGVVAVLATIDRLLARGIQAHVIGLFTRAEEVGLLGAAALARSPDALPPDALVVAVECSSMAGGRAEQGGGPIIRVGDAQHIFSSRMTLWMTQVARELASEDSSFRYQRKLMDGGTTEATAYDFMGFETGAACVALGNYHNGGARNRVAAETVHLGDIDGLAELFVRMASETKRVDTVHRDAQRRWERIGRDAARDLRSVRR